MLKKDIINVAIERQDLEKAIIRAQNTCFIDNLRKRNKFVSFDSKVRGFLGEIAITNILLKAGLKINETNKFDDGENEDIDISVSNQYASNIKIEIKTSLFPDKWKTIDDLIENADIKIIKRESDYKCIKADVCVQIYFNFYRQKRDAFLQTLSGDPLEYSANELIEIMKLNEMHEIFIAWKDRASLIEELSKMKYKTWEYGMRTFWKCPLKTANSPKNFIDFLVDYKR